MQQLHMQRLQPPRAVGAQTQPLRRPLVHCPRQQVTRQRPLGVVQAAQGGEPTDDFLSNIKRIAKKIQGGLPVVGLISRLATPEGGFDEISYPEFCRLAYDTADERFRIASTKFEKRHDKLGRTRWTLLCMWMAKYGVGLLPSKDIIAAARRLRVSQDIEVEMDRFEGGRDAVIKKYAFMERPQGQPAEMLTVACDALCTMCLGLKDGEPVPAEDQPLLVDILRHTFRVPDEQLMAAVAERPNRAGAYS